MSEVRRTGTSILLAVDGLFLGSLLFIAVSVKHAHVARLRDLGVGAPGWPDAGGGPGALLPWAAAGAAALAFAASRLRAPLAPLLPLVAAIGCTLLALYRMGATGATFGSGHRYGTVAHTLAVVWILHLAGAIGALPRHPSRFLALQAFFGVGLAALVYPA